MGPLKPILVLALLLFVPLAAAEEPADAEQIWHDTYGDAGAVAVWFQPDPVPVGVHIEAFIQFHPDADIAGVSGQYCRISNPDTSKGAACFIANLTSVQDGNVWSIDMAENFLEFPNGQTRTVPVTDAGDRRGVQFYVDVRLDNGTVETRSLPPGLPFDDPLFYDDFEAWDETQYFGFDVVGSGKATPAPGLMLAALAVGLALAARRQRA